MAIEACPEIHRMMIEAHAAYQVGDVESAVSRISRNDAAVLVGSDPSHVTRGYRQIVDALRAGQATVPSTGRRYAHATTEAWHDGDVGWALSMGAFRYPDGREIPVRTATVLHRVDGEWRIIQSVAGVAVPDDVLEPGSPVFEALATPAQ
jgi:hypothetical protein